MNRTLLFISLFSIFILVSCQSSPKNEAGKQNEVELVAEKQLAFPLRVYGTEPTDIILCN